VQRVLAARGVRGAEVRRFCEPRLAHLHDPSLMAGAEVAAARLATAVRRGERIVIYGDYDVDGITATAVLYHAVRTADPAAQVRCHVPHRVDEGYGVHVDAVRRLAEEGMELLVTVDCGITAVEAARAAQELGVDLVVTDHHRLQADGTLPHALTIVHPLLPGSDGRPYPFPDLCGAGVAFKLAWCFATHWCGSERVSERFRRLLMDLLPLVALGTIADVVPLLGENRVLASAGLRAIRSSPFPGLQALIRESGLDGEGIDCEKVGFVLAPRLNACGRLGHAAEAVRLFTDADPAEAEQIASALSALNRERQRTEQAIVAEACAMVEAQGQSSPDHRAIVLADPSWHAGVIGIVCSRLVERFGRPTILLSIQDGLCRGSGRSVDGFSLHAALESCSAWLERFGGHEAAAGLTLREAHVEAFRRAFVTCANDQLAPEALVPLQHVDCQVLIEELGLDTVAELARLAPFGRGNRRPALLLQGVRIEAEPRVLKERHLKLILGVDPGAAPRPGQPTHGRGQMARQLSAIWWNAAEHAPRLARGRRLDAVVEPRVSSWSGQVELELRDVRPV
jgi:single-stranded-DNA-specific exonuclease